MDSSGGVLAIVALAVIAGGGIIVIDALVIRKIRALRPLTPPHSEDRTIDK